MRKCWLQQVHMKTLLPGVILEEGISALPSLSLLGVSLLFSILVCHLLPSSGFMGGPQALEEIFLLLKAIGIASFKKVH